MANKIILNNLSHWNMAVRHLYLNKPNRLEIIAMVAINNNIIDDDNTNTQMTAIFSS